MTAAVALANDNFVSDLTMSLSHLPYEKALEYRAESFDKETSFAPGFEVCHCTHPVHGEMIIVSGTNSDELACVIRNTSRPIRTQ